MKKNIDPRKYMEMAIGVMKKSIHEPRQDKASPLVGAVLVMPDGTVDTAFRGELRHGDHAEFTLLERKHRHNDLTGSILFATLEPCAPGSRRHPKLACAERIVLARIREVWIGLEDPDPTVDRKGIKYLQDNGVSVHMFDRDLQLIIEKENSKFLSQAKERAKDIKGKQPAVLTILEKANKKVDLSDLSQEALTFYKEKTGFAGGITSKSFINKLYHKGLLDKEKSSFLPTGLGLILFGKAPEDFYPQIIFKATIRYPNGKIDVQDFGGPLVLIPDAIENWWKKTMPMSIDRSSAQRKRAEEFPYEPVREAVTNALVHRDYDIEGATCHLYMDEEVITVKSPGAPIPPITMTQLMQFNAPTLSRNPRIFSIFAEIGFVERRGLGMETFSAMAQGLSLPLPKYSFTDPYLVLVFSRTFKAINKQYGKKGIGVLNDQEMKGVVFIQGKKRVTKKEYAEYFRISDKSAQRHLSKFYKLGIVKQDIKGPATVYTLQQ